MKKKSFRAPLELKADGEELGQFKAVFSTFNVIDHDGDVTLPGAFENGQKVRISYWGHRWSDLPVGRGVIFADDEKAWVEGQFFMDTEAGSETYKTSKNLGELQEWSYGFDVIDAEQGVFQEQNVTFLKKLKVHEVSPVMLGAGIGTQTLFMKELELQEEPEPKEEPKPQEEPALSEEEIPTESQTEDEASDGKSSGLTPEVVQTIANIETMEV